MNYGVLFDMADTRKKGGGQPYGNIRVPRRVLVSTESYACHFGTVMIDQNSSVLLRLSNFTGLVSRKSPFSMNDFAALGPVRNWIGAGDLA